MRKRDKTMDFKTHNQDNCIDSKLIGAAAGYASFRRFGLIGIVVIGAMLCLSAGSAFGQYGSFTITPMKVEAQITPGKTIQSVLRIQNLDPDSAHTIDLTLVELTQSLQGDWLIIDPNDPNTYNDPNFLSVHFNVKRLASCRSWIRLANNSVTLQPQQFAPLELSIRVPRGEKGFRTAGILATVRPREGMTAVPLSVRFLVPVVVEIETRPIRPRINAIDVGLRYEKASASGPSTTFVSMTIRNDGGTLSRLKPLARIYAYSKNHWHLVTTVEFDEKRIIPGAVLTLEHNIFKALPSGQYKIQGQLYVDDRRTKPVEKILDYQGDPKVTGVKADAPLDLKPLDLMIDCTPGSLRAETITVYNASDETINIQTAKGLQSHLQSTVGSDFKGVDLDCTNWLQISPETFTLPGRGGRKKVQVVAKLPIGATHPCYYSLLALWATYPDGQTAGARTANIFVNNSLIATQPEALGLSVRLNELGDSKYFVSATFRNLKKIHFKPFSVKAGILPTTGPVALRVPRLSTYLSGDPSPMLPLVDRTFVGELDFSTVPAGQYFLTGRLEYAPGEIAYTERLIEISIQGDERIVETKGTQLEIRGDVEVHW